MAGPRAASWTRFHASRLASLARSQARREVPLALSQPWFRSASTLSNVPPLAPRVPKLSQPYLYGWESFGTRGAKGGTFESVEADLNQGWDKAKGTSRLAWDRAKDASRDAWNRVQLAARGPAIPLAH